MKKVDVSFVCDCCGAALPQEFVRKNQNGDLYFDHNSYNRIIWYQGCRVSFGITVEYEYGTDQKDFCPACRVDGLKKILSKLEPPLTKEG